MVSPEHFTIYKWLKCKWWTCCSSRGCCPCWYCKQECFSHLCLKCRYWSLGSIHNRTKLLSGLGIHKHWKQHNCLFSLYYIQPSSWNPWLGCLSLTSRSWSITKLLKSRGSTRRCCCLIHLTKDLGHIVIKYYSQKNIWIIKCNISQGSISEFR